MPSSVNEYAMLSYDEEQDVYHVCREEYLNIIGGNINTVAVFALYNKETNYIRRQMMWIQKS